MASPSIDYSSLSLTIDIPLVVDDEFTGLQRLQSLHEEGVQAERFSQHFSDSIREVHQKIRNALSNNGIALASFNHRWKTELCRSRLANIACPYEERCQYAHTLKACYGINKLWKKAYKSEPCENMPCRYLQRCIFVHPGDLKQNNNGTKWAIERSEVSRPVVFEPTNFHVAQNNFIFNQCNFVYVPPRSQMAIVYPLPDQTIALVSRAPAISCPPPAPRPTIPAAAGNEEEALRNMKDTALVSAEYVFRGE